MKYFFIFPLLFIFNSAIFSQTQAELIGTWKANGASLTEDLELSEAQAEQMDLLLEKFRTSSFEFSKDRSATYNIEIPSVAIADGYWEYDATKNFITIKDMETKTENLMGISVFKTDKGQFYFYFVESSLVLQMEQVAVEASN